MAVTVEQLGAPHHDALRALLARDAAHNLYLLGLLEEFGVSPRAGAAPFSVWGCFERGALCAALFVGGTGGLLVPSAPDGGAMGVIADALAGHVKLKAALGERGAVEALVRTFLAGPARLSKAQRLFCVSADDLGPFTNPTLRLAREDDLPRLLPLAAAAVHETLARDPLAEDAAGFAARVAQRVRGKRTYVLEEGGELVFKVDVGSRCQQGAELEGLYTRPAHRRQGVATLCLGQIARHLLSSLPRLTLRVDESDESLAALARKVGFLAGRTQRLVLAE